MEIQNNHIRKNNFKKIKNKLSKKRIFFLLLLIIGLSGFGLISFFYGISIYKTGRYYPIRMLAHRIIQRDFSFFKNKLNSFSSELDTFNIDLKYVDLKKLGYYREKALLQNVVTNVLEEQVPAMIRYNNETFKVSISLTGRTIEHVQQPEKWSVSVKVKDGKTIFGMKKFALLVPLSRGYLTDWVAHQILIARGCIGLRNNFINVNINGKNIGIYYLEERYDKLLLEHSKSKEGIIFKVIGDSLKIYNHRKIKNNPELSEQLVKLKKLWYSFLNDDIKPNQLVDLQKFASTVVVSDLMNAKHAIFFDNMRLYFNPITCLIEPIAREWGVMQKESKLPFGALFIEDSNLPNATNAHKILYNNILTKKIYDNYDFFEFYLKEANLISKQSYLDSIISYNHDEMDLLLSKIHSQNPFYEFPLEILYENQKLIRNKIHPTLPAIKVTFNNIEKEIVTLSVENKIDLPIEIHYFKYNSKAEILPTNRILIKPNYKSVAVNPNINFLLSIDINPSDFSPDYLEVYYSILGINEIKKTIIFPLEMTENDYSNLNPTMQPANIDEFPFIIINDNVKSIDFPGERCDIQKDLIIPNGYIVSAKAGCLINLTNSATIISHSPIRFFGKSDNLISITSSDSTGQGIFVLNTKEKSMLNHVQFNNLSNPSKNGWELSGAVTFYEADVSINNCLFSNNQRGDDFLNIVRSEYDIKNTHFSNILSDAFDSDYCTGTISHSSFINCGNDAIDISGTKIEINNVILDNIGDKGLSSGENSQMFADNVEISNSEIAICSKDLSQITISNVNLKNNKIGFTAFQKKSEFGPGIIKGSEVKLVDITIPYLIETKSNCSINGEIIKSWKDNVTNILYGNKYGKSSK